MKILEAGLPMTSLFLGEAWTWSVPSRRQTTKLQSHHNAPALYAVKTRSGSWIPIYLIKNRVLSTERKLHMQMPWELGEAQLYATEASCLTFTAIKTNIKSNENSNKRIPGYLV